MASLFFAVRAESELVGESLRRLRRSPSLWQGRLTTDGAAAMDKGGGE